MQVGVTHLIVGDMPLDEFFPQVVAAGYEVVELALKTTGELTPAIDPAGIRRIRDLAAAHKIKLASLCLLHLTGNLLDSGENQRKAIDEMKAGLRIAAELGISNTLTTLGKLRADLFYDDAYRNGVKALKELAADAERHQVVIAVEFIWNGFLFSPLEMNRFLDEVASPWVGFYFDPGNMAVFQFPQHWARIVGKHIKMVHLKDWKGNALNGGWPALLNGTIDYSIINKELRKIGYNGPLISEVDLNAATFSETADSIRKIMKM
jgi:hexulose-6-phosphate isomerase